MAQLLNNPELLRDSMNLISNPVSNSCCLAYHWLPQGGGYVHLSKQLELLPQQCAIAA
jgi:hypothetical protein